MDGSEQDSVDFKPFFDMVVGVLFILLILVAAQMFFAQWQPEAEAPRKTAAEIEAQRLAELRAETDRFLKDVQAKLTAEGFSATVDFAGSMLTVPFGQLRDNASSSIVINRDAAGRLGRGLFAATHCVAAGVEKKPDCLVYRHLRLERLQPRLLVTGETNALPSHSGRIAGLELSSALFGSQPALIGLLTPSGSMALKTAFEVEFLPFETGYGVLQLRYAFTGAGQ